MNVVDTSYLVAAFDGDDRRHAQSRKGMLETPQLLVPTEVLVETLGVVKAKQGRAASVAALDALYGLANIRWVETCDLPHSYRIYKDEGHLSLVDAIGVATALRNDAPLLTHDDRQERALQRLRKAKP